MTLPEKKFLIETYSKVKGQSLRLKRGDSDTINRIISSDCPTLNRFSEHYLLDRASQFFKYARSIVTKQIANEEKDAKAEKERSENAITICKEDGETMELITKNNKRVKGSQSPNQKPNDLSPPILSPSVFAINLTIDQMLSKTLEEIKLTKIDDRKKTKKYQQAQINWDLIDKINKSSLKFFTRASTLKEVTDIYYSAQKNLPGLRRN